MYPLRLSAGINEGGWWRGSGAGSREQRRRSSEGGAARRSGSNMQPRNTARLPPLLLKCHRTSLQSHLPFLRKLFTIKLCVSADCLCHLAILLPFLEIIVFLTTKKARLLKYRKSVTFSRSGGRGTQYKRRNIYVPIFVFTSSQKRKVHPLLLWLPVFTNCKLKHKAVWRQPTVMSQKAQIPHWYLCQVHDNTPNKVLVPTTETSLFLSPPNV